MGSLLSSLPCFKSNQRQIWQKSTCGSSPYLRGNSTQLLKSWPLLSIAFSNNSNWFSSRFLRRLEIYSAVFSASTGHPVSLHLLFLALMRRLMRFLFLLRNMNIKKDFHSTQGKHLGATIGRRFAHTFTYRHQLHWHNTITCFFFLVPVGLLPYRVAGNVHVYATTKTP